MRRTLQRLVLAAILCIAALLGNGILGWYRWREHPDWATGVAVKLKPARQVLKVGEYPHLTVTVVNNGNRDVVLVEPGDGSECGWRTPEIEWSRQTRWGYSRCGNVNALRADEIFVLKPGESRQLSKWVGLPTLSGPGRYCIAVRYVNRPDHRWVGAPLGEPDKAAMEAVRQSNAVSAVSNAVEIIVKE